MDVPRIAVLLVNWNQGPDTAECLDSLGRTHYPHLDILVVDNGSTDGSAEMLAARYPAITLHRAGTNLGFAAATNWGMQLALDRDADFMFCLNNDTIVDPEIFNELLKVMQRDTRIGVVSPKIYAYAEPTRLTFVGGRIHRHTGRARSMGWGEIDHGQYDQLHACEFAGGGGMFVRREVIERVGKFWPDFFIYFEDSDYGVRVRAQGYRIAVAPHAKLWHKISLSLGVDSPYTLYLFARNRLYFIQRNRQGWGWLIFLPVTVWDYLFHVARFVKRRDRTRVHAILLGVYDFFCGRAGQARTRDLKRI